jgi:2-isopropylmalate synthase
MPDNPSLQLLHHEVSEGDEGAEISARLLVDGAPVTVRGTGNGPIAAFIDALERHLGLSMDVVDYAEHALSAGHEAQAAAYVEVTDGQRLVRWGVGIDRSISSASLKAVVSAINHQRSTGTPRLERTPAAARAAEPAPVAPRPGGP